MQSLLSHFRLRRWALFLFVLLFVSTTYLVASSKEVSALTPTIDPGGCNPTQNSINLGNCLRLSDDTKVSEKYTSVGFLVNLIVRNVFVAAGIILFFLLLFAAFRFITGGKKGAEEARTMLVAGVVGFAVMFAAYWIIQIVQVLTGTSIPI